MRALLVIGLLAACSKPNPYYCEGHPDNNCMLDADVNAPMGCTTSAQCTNPAKPVCDTGDKLCVACTAEDRGSCAGTAPVCATATNTCTPCVAHSECASTACLPDGACGDDTNVAYVAPTGDDTNPCTFAAPCVKLTTAATKSKPFIKLQGNVDEAVLLSAVNVTILAEPMTRVTRSATQGPIFELRGTSKIAINDILIRDAGGTTGHGIYVPPGEPVNLTLARVSTVNNGGNGINVQGGTLTMSQCVVSGNFAGGAVINGKFTIESSLFVTNGSNVSTTGGLMLTPSGADVFRFNTVANNSSSSGSITVRGMNCTLPMTVGSSIISGNLVSSSCTFEYSLFDSGMTVGGNNNKAGEARFKNIDALDPMAADFFRIQQNSDAIDGADPTASIPNDVDGDPRPQGNAPDIGADEYK